MWLGLGQTENSKAQTYNNSHFPILTRRFHIGILTQMSGFPVFKRSHILLLRGKDGWNLKSYKLEIKIKHFTSQLKHDRAHSLKYPDSGECLGRLHGDTDI